MPFYSNGLELINEKITKKDNNSKNNMKLGQKRHIASEVFASSNLKLVDIEDKARIFYRLAVVGDRKYRFRTHRSVFVGKEMVDSMVISGLAETREEAVRLGRVLAKKFNLFQNIENNIMNKTIPFEDSYGKFYRFSTGALTVIRNIEGQEINDDQTASTGSTTSTCEGSINNVTEIQSSLPRQTATRNLIIEISESIQNEDEMNINVFRKKKLNKPKALKKKTATNLLSSLPMMQAIVEEENEEKQTENTAISGSNNKEVERLREISELARIQAAFEIEARELPKEEKAKAEKERIKRLRFLAKEQLKMHRSRRISTQSMKSIYEDRHENDAATVDTKERMLTDIVSRLEKSHSREWVANYKSLMVEIDKKVSSIYTGDHKIAQWDDGTRSTSLSEDDIEMVVEQNDSSLIDESHAEEMEDEFQPKESVSKKGNKWKQRLESIKVAKKTTIEKGPVEINKPSKQKESKVEESSNEKEALKFVLSPKDSPTGLLRKTKESFDSFESILTQANDDLPLEDDRSAWTEYIIGDDEGRKQYKLNEIRRSRPSYTSAYVEETVVDDDDEQSYMDFTVMIEDDEICYDEETVYDKETALSQSRASSKIQMKAITSDKGRANRITADKIKKTNDDDDDDDEQSFMDFTVFDNDTVQVSYVEDDINYIAAPEERGNDFQDSTRSIPLISTLVEKSSTTIVTGGVRPAQHAAAAAAFTSSVQEDHQMENNFPIIIADNSSIDDDEMTQITMDHALMDCSNTVNTTRMSNYGNYSSRTQQQPALKKEDTKKENTAAALLCILSLQQQKKKKNESVGCSSSSSSNSSAASTMKSCSSTSKKRIQGILWNDLYSFDNIPLVLSSMEELRTIIVTGEPESRRHIVSFGGVMAIMGTMEEYFEMERIQYLGCIVLELLASMEPDARRYVNEMDGVQLIIRSMQDQAGSDRVQEAGRAALATVCRRY